MSTSEKTESGKETTQSGARPQTQPAAAPSEPGKKREPADETELFAPGVDPQYFGSGSYGMGGSNQEGNYGLGEINPRGGYGDFTDAGGYGSTALYGEESPPADTSERKNVESLPAEGETPPAGGKQVPKR